MVTNVQFRSSPNTAAGSAMVPPGSVRLDTQTMLDAAGLAKIAIGQLSEEQARDLLPKLADRAHIPESGLSLGGGKLHVSKYERGAAGATVIVTTRDPESGEVYVLLGRKKNSQEWIAPGGYMETPPPKGQEVPGKHYDQNLEQTARRELREETGLTFSGGIPFVPLETNSDNSQNPTLHSVNQCFHVRLVGKPGDHQKPVAGDDLAQVRWVKMSDIVKDASQDQQPAGSQHSRFHLQSTGEAVRDLHGSWVEQAYEREVNLRQLERSQQQPQAVQPQVTTTTWQDYVAGRQMERYAQMGSQR